MPRKEEYTVTGEIFIKVESFKAYLYTQGMDPNTIRQKSNYTGYFLKWLEGENLEEKDNRYNDMLNFIDSCRLNGKSIKIINSTLRSVRSYYEFLKLTCPDVKNPALNLFVKGEPRKVISGIVDFKTLESIYSDFKADNLREKRNRVILGLLIYQGITTEELSALETSHLKLKEGKIHVPGNRRRCSRVLELKPFQVMELYEYLNEVRPRILEWISEPKPFGRRPDKINTERIGDQLFISVNGSEHIKNSMLHLFRLIRKTYPDIISARQIRQSVLFHWLKDHNLRQVQYMAGHRWVSSTERYKLNNLDSLQSKIEKFHPLSKNPKVI